MTRIRQWLVSLALAAVLTLSFATVASADPGDPGGGFSTASAPMTETDDGRTNGKKSSSYSTTIDPGDPGGGW